MVGCLFVRSGFLVLGRLTMMLGSLIVMMCCFLMMLVDFWHLYLPVNRLAVALTSRTQRTFPTAKTPQYGCELMTAE
jgi:hypothetical protein